MFLVARAGRFRIHAGRHRDSRAAREGGRCGKPSHSGDDRGRLPFFFTGRRARPETDGHPGSGTSAADCRSGATPGMHPAPPDRDSGDNPPMNRPKPRLPFPGICLLLACLLAPPLNAAIPASAGGRASADAWLRQYALAWEHRDVTAAGALYAENAEYRESPFQAPLRGEKAIRAYWDRIVRGQRNVRMRYRILSVEGGTSIVHWQASFVRVPSGRKVRLDGIAEITLDGHDKCVRFLEWWNLQQT